MSNPPFNGKKIISDQAARLEKIVGHASRQSCGKRIEVQDNINDSSASILDCMQGTLTSLKTYKTNKK